MRTIIAFIIFTILSSSGYALNCRCSDKNNLNYFTIQGFAGGACSELVQTNTQATLSAPLTGMTTCTLGSEQFSCNYQLQRIHIANCEAVS